MISFLKKLYKTLQCRPPQTSTSFQTLYRCFGLIPTKHPDRPPRQFNDFHVKRANEEQREKILDCLRRTLLLDEPLLQAVRIAGGSICAAYEEHVISSLREGLSFIVVERSNNEIIGVCINGVLKPNEPQAPKQLVEKMNQHCQSIIKFDELCYQQSDLFRRYSVSQIFDVQYLGVVPKHRKAGLATFLTTHGIRLAKERHLPLVCMHSTSEFSYKLAVKLGMKEEWSKPYSEILDANHKPMFRPRSPHTRNLKVKRAAKEHREKVLACLRRSLFLEEPVLQAMHKTGGSISPAYEDYVVSSLGQGVSFIMLERPKDELIGVSINGILKPNEPQVSKQIVEKMNQHCQSIIKLDEFCYKQSDLFRRYSVSEIFDVQYLGVIPERRKQGLATVLSAYGIRLAKEHHFPLVSMLCSSEYSYRLGVNLGMKESWSMPFSEILDENKKPMFRTEDPHTKIRMMVLTLK